MCPESVRAPSVILSEVPGAAENAPMVILSEVPGAAENAPIVILSEVPGAAGNAVEGSPSVRSDDCPNDTPALSGVDTQEQDVTCAGTPASALLYSFV